MKNRIISISLAVVLALSIGLIGCTAEEAQKYNLTISSMEGGSVTTPGEGTFTYSEGERVNLAAKPDEGYQFANWTGDVGTVANVNIASTAITMNDDYSITATFAVKKYSLVIHSTEGGSVTTPGANAYAYDKGKVVNLVAVADEGYVFINWTGDVSTIADANAASTTITMNSGYSITANFAGTIRDWYDLDTVRNNLDGSYVLMNDLDSTSAAYTELASPIANGGNGWKPIGSFVGDASVQEAFDPVDPFIGSFDGQAYAIRDLFVSRPDEDGVGLFSLLGAGGVIENLGVENAEVIGRDHTGGLVAYNQGTVNNSSFVGTVVGDSHVGGLVGKNWGTVANSYSGGGVTGNWCVGGLVGWNIETVSDCHFSGSVSGEQEVGSLVGWHWGSVSDSYAAGTVTGDVDVGGLVGCIGWNAGTVSNSHYNYDETLLNGKKVITVGALFSQDFGEWLANSKFLDVNEKLSQEDGHYVINDVADFKQLLAFGQDGSLRFRLKDDLDLGNEPDFYIPYLAGKFDGNGRRIRNLGFNLNFVAQVGLFGYLAPGGQVTRVGVENANMTGSSHVGGVVGWDDGTVSDCYSSGGLIRGSSAGGLVGAIHLGTVTNSYASGSVAGSWVIGGLVGWNYYGTVSNSYYNYDQSRINGQNMITIGALSNEDFEQWLTNDKVLDINTRLSLEDGYYVINSVNDFKQLLAFGQDGSLKFKLKDDLDLGSKPNFYIPYLAGEFDGDGHKIWNLHFDVGFVANVGLFGYLAPGGKVKGVGVENASITGAAAAGGVVGHNRWGGIVGDSYSNGSVTGSWNAGGLVGWNDATVNNCYSLVRVTGDVRVGGLMGASGGTVTGSYSRGSVTGREQVGGLTGENSWGGSVSNCYSTGSVTGARYVGGLVGFNDWASTVSSSYSTGSVAGEEYIGGLVGYNDNQVVSCFWDMEACGMEESDGGSGKTTEEMQRMANFAGAAWNIVAVANPSTRNPSYIWNIVDGQTYPFLSWQA